MTAPSVKLPSGGEQRPLRQKPDTWQTIEKCQLDLLLSLFNVQEQEQKDP